MSTKNDKNQSSDLIVKAVTSPDKFKFAVIGLQHNHIYAMCNSLKNAGAGLSLVFDADRSETQKFLEQFPEASEASSLEAILDDPTINLVVSTAVPSERGPLGIRVQEAGKHYFSDKAAFTTLDQLEAARLSVKKTGKKWAINYAERIRNESAIYAGTLISEGAIGRVIQVMGMGPHRLRPESRPDWFFRKETSGGILMDIGSHQIDQFLFYSGSNDAEIISSRVGNVAHSEYPEFEDLGDVTLQADNGASGYFRVDWFTPDGLSAWGDARSIIMGTEGYIEIRKNLDVARDSGPNHVILVNGDGEQHINVDGKVGFPYFGQLILDCLQGTETAMTQEHAFKVAELAIIAQEEATKIKNGHKQ